jgi:transcriptional regulator with XRE-family HTH domain
MLNTQSEIVTRAGHMTEAEYDRERARIAPTKAGAKAQAGVRWEQELARLFHLSGWTLVELAKKEGKSKSTISNWLQFGRFMAFAEKFHVQVELTENLTLHHFQQYWALTGTGKKDDSGLHDRERFNEIIRRLKEAPIVDGRIFENRKKPIPKAIGQTIAKTCPKGKWVSPDAIAAKADCTVANVHSVMDSMDRKPGSYGLKAERKKVGKETHYRVFKQDKMVSLDEMTEKLTPIIKGLEVEGKKHVAQRVPAEIARLVFQLKRLLDEWAE